ncbi:hypothetical protein LTR85_007133 [Meristemomyces frigidus]|nr:hypothetical protein LTR85_007133 [Meristemomyces frigidus]
MFEDDADDSIAPVTGPAVAQFGAKDIGWQALGTAIAFAVLSTCVVALRWYTRCRLVRCVGWDDYVISLSLLLAWTSTSLIAAAVCYGVGLYDGPVQTAIITQLVVANNDIWSLTVNVTKASILMQYLRVFSSRTIRATCYLLLLCLIPAACWAVFGGTFLCTPVRKLWEPQIAGHCMSAEKYWLSVAGTNTGLDFLVLLLPIPAISGLHLPRKQKLSLVLVFTLGFFVCATSLARLATVLVTSDEGHYVVSGIWAIIWSTIEANVGIICACLLALKPLVALLFPILLDDGDEIPKHCMRLPTVQTGGGAWPSDDAMQVSPTTPTTMKSKSESTSPKRSTTAHAAPPPDFRTVYLQTPPPPRRRGGDVREVINIMDMLHHGGDDLE